MNTTIYDFDLDHGFRSLYLRTLWSRAWRPIQYFIRFALDKVKIEKWAGAFLLSHIYSLYHVMIQNIMWSIAYACLVCRVIALTDLPIQLSNKQGLLLYGVRLLNNERIDATGKQRESVLRQVWTWLCLVILLPPSDCLF